MNKNWDLERRTLLSLIENLTNHYTYVESISMDYERNCRVYKPFSPSQYMEKTKEEIQYAIDKFTSKVMVEYEGDSETFLESIKLSKEYIEYKNNLIPNPYPFEDNCPNYAVVIINNAFHLLKAPFYHSEVNSFSPFKRYILNTNKFDIKTFVEYLSYTKGYFTIGEFEKNITDIQIGESRDKFIELKLMLENDYTFVEYEGVKIKLEKDKAFFISYNLKCYVEEVILTKDGFEISDTFTDRKFILDSEDNCDYAEFNNSNYFKIKTDKETPFIDCEVAETLWVKHETRKWREFDKKINPSRYQDSFNINDDDDTFPF